MRRRHLLVLLAAAATFTSARAGSYEDFFHGIELDRPAILRPLLAKGFDVNARTEDGQHGLYIALHEHSFEVVPLFVQHPALEVDAVNEAGETLLMMAALRSQHAAMRALMARGAKVNRSGWTPLHYAASGGDVAAARMLVEAGAALDARAPNGNTPLMMAAAFGFIDVADWLLGQGADAAAVNRGGRTASDMALSADRHELSRRIRARAGASPR